MQQSPPPAPGSAARSGAVEAGHARPAQQLGRVVGSEWIKARSVPSTWAALCSMLFILPVIGAVISAGLSAEDVSGPAAQGFEPLLQAYAGVAMSQVALGVLGALLITGEYSSRSITTTVAAVPQRGVLLTAKAVLLTVLTAPFALLGSTAAALASLPLLRDQQVDLATTDGAVVRAVVGTAGVLTLTALLGLAVGALLRSTAAAVITLTFLLFLAPVLVELSPDGVRSRIGPWTPSRAGAAVLPLRDRPEYLEPAAGVLLLAAYVLSALLAAVVVLRRRDV
jgi:hypothetical protein